MISGARCPEFYPISNCGRQRLKRADSQAPLDAVGMEISVVPIVNISKRAESWLYSYLPQLRRSPDAAPSHCSPWARASNLMAEGKGFIFTVLNHEHVSRHRRSFTRRGSRATGTIFQSNCLSHFAGIKLMKAWDVILIIDARFNFSKVLRIYTFCSAS